MLCRSVSHGRLSLFKSLRVYFAAIVGWLGLGIPLYTYGFRAYWPALALLAPWSGSPARTFAVGLMTPPLHRR